MDASRHSWGSTSNIVQQPLSNHSLRRENEGRVLQRSATVSHEQYLSKDDAENLSQVHLVRGSTPAYIIQQPLNPRLSPVGKRGDSWHDESNRKVLFSAPAYSNRVQPITDYQSPTVDYTRPPTRDYIPPPSRDGALETDTYAAHRSDVRSSDTRSLRSARVGGSSRANDHLNFTVVLMFSCLLCFIPSGGLTSIGALCLLPALICAAVSADYNKEGRLKEARSLGLAALICSAVTIILTAVFVVLGAIGGVIALQLLVLARN